jgi:hypothetical protein
VTVALIGAGGVSADPTNAPGAETVTYVCGGVPITLTTLPNNSSAAFTISTSVGIAVDIVITDVATGEVLFSVVNHGFDVNAVQATACTATSTGRRSP